MTPGDQLYIEHYLTGGGKYVSKIAEIKEDVLHIQYPVCLHTNRKMYLVDGKRIKCMAHSASGKIFFFSGRVVGHMNQTTSLVKIAYAKQFTLVKEQMREFVRMDVNESIEIQPLDDRREVLDGISRNISAGGIAVVVNHYNHMHNRAPVLLRFSLMIEGKKHAFILASECVRKEELADGRFVVSFKFSKASGEDRQKLMRYCFEQQLLHMKKSKQTYKY